MTRIEDQCHQFPGLREGAQKGQQQDGECLAAWSRIKIPCREESPCGPLVR